MNAFNSVTASHDTHTVLERTRLGACALLADRTALTPEAEALLARLTGYTPICALARDGAEARRFAAAVPLLLHEGLARPSPFSLH